MSIRIGANLMPVKKKDIKGIFEIFSTDLRLILSTLSQQTLCVFKKVRRTNLHPNCSKQGRGVKGFLNDVNKLQYWLGQASLIEKTYIKVKERGLFSKEEWLSRFRKCCGAPSGYKWNESSLEEESSSTTCRNGANNKNISFFFTIFFISVILRWISMIIGVAGFESCQRC